MTFFHVALYMNMPVLADLQELIYISSLQAKNLIWKLCRERWVIGMQIDDDENAVIIYNILYTNFLILNLMNNINIYIIKFYEMQLYLFDNLFIFDSKTIKAEEKN